MTAIKKYAMVTRLSETIWWVDFPGVNAYLVDDDVLTLVDAGPPLYTHRLVNAITQAGGALSSVERILITHYDFDHVGALGKLKALDAPVYIGRADAPYLTGDRKPSIRSQKGLFHRAAHWAIDLPDLPIVPIDDGKQLGSFTAYHTPGHTPGHMVYISEEHDVGFLGDIVWERRGTIDTIPWFLCEDYERTKQSLVDLAGHVPPFEIVCPGHGVPFTERGRDRLQASADSVTVKSV